ncbi:MAG: response regulator [Planctomycetes bacterium]|nr:response regulator [Planctomycetota bacterium]
MDTIGLSCPVDDADTLTRPHHLLVVDDDHDLRLGLKCHLGALGYDVSLAARGQHAISIVQRKHVDCVVLDLGLPDIPGIEVLQHLKVIRPNLPIIVVSAWNELKWEATTLDRGALLYLEKPVPPEQLFAAIQSLML